jgi:hypothetical protein
LDKTLLEIYHVEEIDLSRSLPPQNSLESSSERTVFSRPTFALATSQKLGPVRKMMILGMHLRSADHLEHALAATDTRNLRQYSAISATVGYIIKFTALHLADLYFDVMSLITGLPK